MKRSPDSATTLLDLDQTREVLARIEEIARYGAEQARSSVERANERLKDLDQLKAVVNEAIETIWKR